MRISFSASTDPLFGVSGHGFRGDISATFSALHRLAGVGARRFLGRSPASSGGGRPAGGARTFAPLFGSLLSSREFAHGAS